MKAYYLVATAVVLLFSYTDVRAAHSISPAKAASAAAAATDNSAVAEANRVQTYTGTIALLNGSLYILRDERNDTWYHLDDQQQAMISGEESGVDREAGCGVNMICVKTSNR